MSAVELRVAVERDYSLGDYSLPLCIVVEIDDLRAVSAVPVVALDDRRDAVFLVQAALRLLADALEKSEGFPALRPETVA